MHYLFFTCGPLRKRLIEIESEIINVIDHLIEITAHIPST